jgi:hypothetical protein
MFAYRYSLYQTPYLEGPGRPRFSHRLKRGGSADIGRDSSNLLFSHSSRAPSARPELLQPHQSVVIVSANSLQRKKAARIRRHAQQAGPLPGRPRLLR